MVRCHFLSVGCIGTELLKGHWRKKIKGGITGEIKYIEEKINKLSFWQDGKSIFRSM